MTKCIFVGLNIKINAHMAYKTEKEELEFDCQIKAKNLQAALESVTINNFQSYFLIQNYIKCKKESIAAVEKLIKFIDANK
jgi:hypothetical protein